ncbi:MAG: cobyrinate a,c-diamide synthase, partial [Roseburia sp.]
QAFKNQGKRLSAFKCGPDYIDPMFHQKVIGIPSKNLDSYFAEENLLEQSFSEGTKNCELAILEGAMGLYDGLGGILEDGSAYEVARITRTPIILVVDARGMGRSIIPLLKGFLEYDTAHLIKGVILNKTSGMFYETLKRQIEQELDIAVAGYFPVRKELQFESRHLGLVLPQEKKELKAQLAAAAEQAEKSISFETILQIAESAEPIKDNAESKEDRFRLSEEKKSPIRIAVARDEAFCFYYEDNLQLLEKKGAELVFFSPIHEKELPKNCQGMLLGGGYPELYLEQLSDNKSMRESIRQAIANGMPSLAECGGFMYLHEKIISREGTAFEMAGVLKADCTYQGKLVRFGYLELEGKTQDALLRQKETIRGHEFHYFDSRKNGEDAFATKPVTEKQWSCCHAGKRHLWGFPHLYYPSNPVLVERFLDAALDYEQVRKQK